MKLGDNALPWVQKGKHLGNTLENIMNGMRKDITVKRGKFIEKNNEIGQEFHFCRPDLQFQLNNIYNSHFTGSSLWDLFSRECRMVENSWNVSFRKMYDLPRTTHRYFVEPVSGIPHIKSQMIKNFLSFILQIQRSSKIVPNVILEQIKFDVRSVTGSNLRNILDLTDKDSIEDLRPSDAMRIRYLRRRTGESGSIFTGTTYVCMYVLLCRD